VLAPELLEPLELLDFPPLELELLELLDFPPLELELLEVELPELLLDAPPLELELLELELEVGSLSATVAVAGEPMLASTLTDVIVTKKCLPQPRLVITGIWIDFGATSPSDHVTVPSVDW
jgi:hypothetical protein